MNEMTQLAALFQAYAPAYDRGSASGMIDMAINTIVNALIYGLIFKMMNRLSLPEAFVVVGAALFVLFLWSRYRDRRGP